MGRGEEGFGYSWDVCAGARQTMTEKVRGREREEGKRYETGMRTDDGGGFLYNYIINKCTI